MDAETLYEKLKVVHEAKGYYFNSDTKRTMELIEALIINKNRYGYMACPCRLASGNLDEDKDIRCPCVYRAPDVKEFGACYCKLYVSENLKDKNVSKLNVPERRPDELIPYFNE